MKNSTHASALSILALLAGAAAHGQVYQKADTTPVEVAGVPNPPTLLQSVVATADGGYIAVGGEGTYNLHICKYHADGTVEWSKFATLDSPCSATSIGQMLGGPGLFAVVGEVFDTYPFGAFIMLIDSSGALICSKEFNGAGGSVPPLGRSPVAVRPLSDLSFAVTGRGHLGSVASPMYGRITKISESCAVEWSMLYAPGGIAGASGCEVTDVVEEPGGVYLLAVGTVSLSSGGNMPFLLRVMKATGAVVGAKYYGDGTVSIHGDGIALATSPTGGIDGYIFDGRMNPGPAGLPGPSLNYIVKVDMGLSPMWGETITDFEPCHACVKNYGTSTLLAGSHSPAGTGPAGVQAALIDSPGGAVMWDWQYGAGPLGASAKGHGVAITTLTTTSPVGPIIVGETGVPLSGGYLVKGDIGTGSSGGCEFPVTPPTPYMFVTDALFSAYAFQQYRGIVIPLFDETLSTIAACGPTGGRHCSADFDGDGAIGTDADIEAFFACLGGSCCPTCESADFNGDGAVGTDADIASFFSVLGGGPC
jgi:hypothetical protein